MHTNSIDLGQHLTRVMKRLPTQGYGQFFEIISRFALKAVHKLSKNRRNPEQKQKETQEILTLDSNE